MQKQRFKNSFAENLPWLAGFFDGDGCIYCKPRIRKYKNTTYIQQELQVIIGQSGEIGLDLCRALQRDFGFGKISSGHASALSKQQAYLTRLSGKKAVAFLKQLFPYLILKQNQAKQALELMETRYGKK